MHVRMRPLRDYGNGDSFGVNMKARVACLGIFDVAASGWCDRVIPSILIPIVLLKSLHGISRHP